jgi:hypothetical protein
VMIATSPEFRKAPPRAGLLNLGSTVAPPSPLHRRDAKRGLEGVGFRFAAISRGVEVRTCDSYRLRVLGAIS